MSEIQSTSEQLANERIGDFNPSDSQAVNEIKNAAKQLIIAIDQHCPNGRQKSVALTEVETAQMYAVKSLFVPE